MKELESYFFGENDELFFTSLTEAVLKRHYFVLGQLSALAILNIGRGPQCFNAAVADNLLHFPRNFEITNVTNGEYLAKIKEIEENDNSHL